MSRLSSGPYLMQSLPKMVALPLSGINQRQEQADRGRLARPVRPDKAEDLPLIDVK
jgi:hypothetical protein